MAPRIFTDKQESEIARLYVEDGLSSRSIAKIYGIKFHSTIRYALERQGVQFRKPQDANRLYQLNPYVFDKIDNEHAAYWLGFLYADGYIQKRSLTVVLRYSDADHLEKLAEFLKTDSPVRQTSNNCSNGKTYKSCKLEITERHLAKRLKQCGIVPGRGKLDGIVNNVPPSLNQHWIRGLFDGDGSARKSRSLAFCGSQDLMIFIRSTLANQAGTNPDISVTKHSKANLYYIYYSGINVALQVTSYMYQDATVWMERKKKVVESWEPPMPPNTTRDELGRYASA